VLPAVILSAVWALVSSSDVAVWRMIEGTLQSPEHFQPLWKLQFMLRQPAHFPTLLAGTYHYIDDYWLQLIGILGWLDTRLQPWTYPVLSILLLAVLCVPLDENPKSRLRIAVVSAFGLVGYCLTVFLVFYLTWTSLDAEQIDGVQGRYFVVVLPLVAALLSALIN
jgi:uncharacterized membrane protein